MSVTLRTKRKQRYTLANKALDLPTRKRTKRSGLSKHLLSSIEALVLYYFSCLANYSKYYLGPDAAPFIYCLSCCDLIQWFSTGVPQYAGAP